MVLDLGRPPLARFPSGDKKLSLSPVTKEDLEYAIAQVERGRSALKGVQGCWVGCCSRLSPPKQAYKQVHVPNLQVGDFGGDNRAGIDRTLHRISCMRNR